MQDQTDLSQLDQDTTLEVAKSDLKPVSIEPFIRVIRGQQVILDADLAPLYGIETKRLKEQVNRNLSRFPEDFMFKLSASELNSLRSQFATSNKRGGTRYAPDAFTDLQRHNAQYSPIAINEFQNAHDRFLCIDDTVYHIGASLKDLGKKWFAFGRMEIDTDMLLQKNVKLADTSLKRLDGKKYLAVSFPKLLNCFGKIC